MVLTIALITIVIGLIAVYLWTINNSYDYFKRHGIPGPPHRFFFGHYKDLWSAKSFSKQLQQWTRQYGSIYGLFGGTQPIYVVSDVDFLQEVYIKQFSSFHTRVIPKVFRVESDGKIHLFRASGASWRRQRHVINPTFSSAKLKQMSPLVNGCIETMLDKISQLVNNNEKEINIYELYKRLTMDVICKSINLIYTSFICF
jgi:cytochrome P450